MAAKIGGLWDSMLGEGRHWWITATSDSHVNWRDGGGDFWPGENFKTYVKAGKTMMILWRAFVKGMFTLYRRPNFELDVKVQAGGKFPCLHNQKEIQQLSVKL